VFGPNVLETIGDGKDVWEILLAVPRYIPAEVTLFEIFWATILPGQKA
jgi:hypothetical protein